MKKLLLLVFLVFKANLSAQPIRSEAVSPAGNQSIGAYIDVIPVDKKRAVVIIEGSKGSGTGFIGKLRGRLFIFTNQHVIAGNESIRISTISGDSLRYESLFTAIDHDVAMFRLNDISVSGLGLPFLEIETDPLANTKAGDKVVIPGNSLGAGTLLQARGEVIAFGPQLIEHNAPTFSGNSGSPIILESSWKVIGVDTLSKKSMNLDWANAHSRSQQNSQIKSNVRLFGYRIDTIKQWQQIDLDAYNAQYAEVDELLSEIADIHRGLTAPSGYYPSPEARSVALYSRIEQVGKRLGKAEPKAYDFFKKDYADLKELLKKS